ncbi:glycosyltransferase [bacterium]|nr:glycosyltransferase [bacterium]
MNNLPFVSVIVPVYNGEKIIEGCIESLLDQDYPRDKYELIVVDNNSRDKTAQIIRRYPVRYIVEDKIRTSYAARNEGIRYAKGEILAFIDADCIAFKNWIRVGAGAFKKDNTGCVAGIIKGTKPKNYVEEYLIKENTLSQDVTLNHNFLPYPQTANTFYRKIVFENIGYFEKKWVSGGDGDLAWRMQLNTNYKIKFIPDAVVLHKHRSTIKSMFKQRVKWGIGETLLYKKYRRSRPKRKFRETMKDLYVLIHMIGKIIRLELSFCEKEEKKHRMRKKFLDLIAFMGQKIGMLIGSIKNRIYYV